MQTRGYQLAEPGKASMFSYIEVPFAYFLQVMGTTSSLSKSSMLGAVLIIISCVVGAYGQYNLEHEDTAGNNGTVVDVVKDSTEFTPLKASLMGRRTWSKGITSEPYEVHTQEHGKD